MRVKGAGIHTRGHDFRILLIDSNSKKVVGQIAIK